MTIRTPSDIVMTKHEKIVTGLGEDSKISLQFFFKLRRCEEFKF